MEQIKQRVFPNFQKAFTFIEGHNLRRTFQHDFSSLLVHNWFEMVHFAPLLLMVVFRMQQPSFSPYHLIFGLYILLMTKKETEVIMMSRKNIFEAVLMVLTVLLTALQSIVGTGETK